ncbi:hypothetical protein [Thermoanaerobacter wiegelii]|uniref:hypothetical protein n=1 Tax=Thermoanaerobacter wiegelii TaxID=46354 RepID=UPI0001E4F98D|nr:hypothetical protein [Thermoanaerobacter wiegelii]
MDNVSPSAIGDIRAWYFMDSNHAWIFYSNETLYRTKDRGKNWIGEKVPFSMGKLFFVNSDGEYQGWELKKYGPASGNVFVDVYKLVSDKWIFIHKGELPNNTSSSTNSLPYEGEKKSFIFLPDGKTGFVAIERREPGKYGLYITTDGGNTWNRKDIPLLSECKNDSILIYPFKFFDNKGNTVIIWPVSIYNGAQKNYQTIF